MPDHKTIANAEAHEPKHITDAVTGDNEKIITPSASVSGTSSLEYLSYPITVNIPDISTAQSVFVVSPIQGDITSIYTVIDGAIATADATITAEIGGTLVTGSSITVAFSGSAAGDVDFSNPSAARSVTAGQAIEIITDGGSTNTVRCQVTLWIKRTG